VSVIVRLHNEDALAHGGLLPHGKRKYIKIEMWFPNCRRHKGDFKQAAY